MLNTWSLAPNSPLPLIPLLLLIVKHLGQLIYVLTSWQCMLPCPWWELGNVDCHDIPACVSCPRCRRGGIKYTTTVFSVDHILNVKCDFCFRLFCSFNAHWIESWTVSVTRKCHSFINLSTQTKLHSALDLNVPQAASRYIAKTMPAE